MPTANGALEFDGNADGDVRRRRLSALAEKLSISNSALFRPRTEFAGAFGDWRNRRAGLLAPDDVSNRGQDLQR